MPSLSSRLLGPRSLALWPGGTMGTRQSVGSRAEPSAGSCLAERGMGKASEEQNMTTSHRIEQFP